MRGSLTFSTTKLNVEYENNFSIQFEHEIKNKFNFFPAHEQSVKFYRIKVQSRVESAWEKK